MTTVGLYRNSEILYTSNTIRTVNLIPDNNSMFFFGTSTTSPFTIKNNSNMSLSTSDTINIIGKTNISPTTMSTTSSNTFGSSFSINSQTSIQTSGASTDFSFSSFRIPFVTGSGTITNSHTVYIEGAPLGISTNKYSLYINSGNSLFNGPVQISTLSVTGPSSLSSTTVSSLFVTGNAFFTSISVTGPVSFSTLTVTNSLISNGTTLLGATTITGPLRVTGGSNFTTITADSGTFTTLQAVNFSATGSATFTTLTVSNSLISNGITQLSTTTVGSITLNNSVFATTLGVGSGNALAITSGNKIVDTVSLRRYKENEVDYLDSGYDPKLILKLKPKFFTWKDSGERDLGLIVEDSLEEKDTEIFIYFNNEGPKNYKDRALLSGIIALLQQQQKEIDELKQKTTTKTNFFKLF